MSAARTASAPILHSIRSARAGLLCVLLLVTACAPSLEAPGSPAAPGSAVISDPTAQVARSADGVVSSASVFATEVGARVLAEGGNAVDAAVATAFALAVAEPSMSGLGGRASTVIRTADGETVGLDGLNQVPSGYREGSGIPPGYERAAIPGVPAALTTALDRFGTWPLDRVMEGAIRLAEEGFPLPEGEAGRWRGGAEDLSQYPASRAVYLRPDGAPWESGDRVVQRELGRTLRAIADGGADAFYHGWIADSIEADMSRNGGFVLREELAGYEALPALPATGSYRGFTVISNFRPAAGHTVVQALQSLEGIDVPGADDPAGWASVVGQAMHYALEDRGARHGTEEESARVLTSLEHARARAAAFRLPSGQDDGELIEATATSGNTRLPGASRGSPPAAVSEDRRSGTFPAASYRAPAGTLVTHPADRESTTHMSVIDGDGMIVTHTQSLGPSLGTRLTASGLGFLYATRLGGEPGSRPGSTISPTLVLHPDGTPFFALGGAGDARIISAVIQVISRVVDHGMTLEEAVAAPRVHPDGPLALRIEDGPTAGWGPEVRGRLEGWGFTVEPAPSGYFGRVHAVAADDAGHLGVAEPRWAGSTAGPVR